MLKSSISAGVLFALTTSIALAQSTTIEALQASAKAYAGTDWAGTYTRLCIPTIPAADQVKPTIDPADYPSGEQATPPGGTPCCRGPPPGGGTKPARCGEPGLWT